MNPIYGMILCYNGFLTNNYYLHKNKFINTNESRLINKICKKIPYSVRPTNYIMKEIKPIDIGRYIAIKYIDKNDNIIKIIDKNNIFFHSCFFCLLLFITCSSYTLYIYPKTDLLCSTYYIY